MMRTIVALLLLVVGSGFRYPSGDITPSPSSGGGGTGGVTYPLQGPSDSAGAPDYSWSASPTTGLFSPTANICAASANGAEIMRWNSAGAVIATGKQLQCASGTAAAPCLTFSAAPDRGFFSDGTNSGIGIAVLGTQTGYFNAGGLSQNGNLVVGGLATVGNANVVGNATINGTATLGTASVTNNATVGGTLGVTGLSTLTSAAVTNNATVGGTLGVTGVTTATAGFRAGNGNNLAPTYAFTGNPNTGIYFDATLGLVTTVAGNRGWNVTSTAELVNDQSPTGGNNRIRLGANNATGVQIFRGGSGIIQFGLPDDSANATARARMWQTTNLDTTTQFSSTTSSDITGLRLYYDTSASAANNYATVVQQRILVTQKSAAYTVVKADTGRRFNNTGASTQTVFTLPAATAVGTLTAYGEVPFYVFTNIVSQGLQIKASGSDVLQFPGAASTAGGTQTTTTVGGSVKIYVCDTAKWCVEGAVGGTWTAA